MAFFSRFPLTSYAFGDNETPVFWYDLTPHVHVIDETRDAEPVTIQDGERPDHLSWRLYDRADLHWTFFLMNPRLCTSGFPLSQADLVKRVQRIHSNRVITTHSPIAGNFFPGTEVRGLTSGTHGIVRRREIDMGQIFIEAPHPFAASETVIDVSESNIAVQTISEVPEYNSPLYYTRAGSSEIAYDAPVGGGGDFIPRTVMEDQLAYNAELRQILALRSNRVQAVVNQFFNLLKQ